MRLLHHDLHVLTGAYAVDAIDDEVERDQFERHMRRCQPCTGEVRGLTETATRLAFATATPAPPRLRGQVMAAVARTRQLPPVVDHRRPALMPRSTWASRLAWATAAASIAVAIAGVFVLLHVQRQLDSVRSQDRALAAVLAAPDARAVTQPTSAGGTGTVVFSLAQHSMIFTSAGLPPLPSGKVYELWLLGPPRVRPAGLLPGQQGGRSAPVLAMGLVRGDQVGVTVEPAGGTRLPTTTPILVIKLRS